MKVPNNYKYYAHTIDNEVLKLKEEREKFKMMYKDFQAVDVIKANFDNMEEKTMTNKEEKRQAISEIVSGTIKGLMVIGIIYIICCLVFGLAASASTYNNYVEWRKSVYDIVVEELINNNDLYYEVWEAEELRENLDTLEHRKDELTVIEHTQMVIIDRDLTNGKWYGYGQINEYVVINDPNMELKPGDMVDCWYLYDNTNNVDGIESVYYRKTLA